MLLLYKPSVLANAVLSCIFGLYDYFFYMDLAVICHREERGPGPKYDGLMIGFSL
jgi:hypothetical protein